MTQTTTIQPMELDHGRRIAAKIVSELMPFCARIEICGSIRRARPFVNDIDLVVLAKDEPGLRTRILRNCIPDRAEGDQNILCHLQSAPNVKLDIWIAQPAKAGLFEIEPSNIGTLMICRTGSKFFNMWFAQEAHKHDLHWNPYRGVMCGDTIIASETEEGVFKALKLDFIKPEQRER
jgi:DNA polymerase (family 10)